VTGTVGPQPGRPPADRGSAPSSSLAGEEDAHIHEQAYAHGHRVDDHQEWSGTERDTLARQRAAIAVAMERHSATARLESPSLRANNSPPEHKDMEQTDRKREEDAGHANIRSAVQRSMSLLRTSVSISGTTVLTRLSRESVGLPVLPVPVPQLRSGERPLSLPCPGVLPRTTGFTLHPHLPYACFAPDGASR
jgi:hypothetical protein